MMDSLLILYLLILWPSKLIESPKFSDRPSNPTPWFAYEETETQSSVWLIQTAGSWEDQEDTTQDPWP